MKRTPRNYDGTAPVARTLQELLPQVLSRFQRGGGGSGPGQEVLASWPEIAGPSVAKLTQATSFVDGILTVLVKSSTLYSLLRQHEKARLLELLKQRFSKLEVRDIVFRIGGS